MIGIDISEHQFTIDLSNVKCDFVIMKATEGVDYVDPYFNKFTVQLTGLDRLIGCYHFARPDNRKTAYEMKNEAYNFIRTVENAGIIGKSILVLDWEVEPLNTRYIDYMHNWLYTVKEETGITPFIYASQYNLIQFFKNTEYKFLSEFPIWTAFWKSNIVYPIKATDNSPEAFDWAIWQYDGKGKIDGYSGQIDLNYCPFDKEWWERMSGKKINGGDEYLTDDMKWAIDIGLFRGYGDGSYRPKQYVTREQVATLFRRFYGLEK